VPGLSICIAMVNHLLEERFTCGSQMDPFVFMVLDEGLILAWEWNVNQIFVIKT
jgi:hypothetical protein